jgi:starvation-inducible DNA-binding protein
LGAHEREMLHLGEVDMRRTDSEAIASRQERRAIRNDQGASDEIGGVLNRLLADVFAIYMKTKNFHWHMSGPHFRDYHLLLDEQADQLFAMTDSIAERVRKLGSSTLHSIGEIGKLQRVKDSDASDVEPLAMLSELYQDNECLAASMREAHEICEARRDVATTSLLEVWVDETERREWFLLETTRHRKR